MKALNPINRNKSVVNQVVTPPPHTHLQPHKLKQRGGLALLLISAIVLTACGGGGGSAGGGSGGGGGSALATQKVALLATSAVQAVIIRAAANVQKAGSVTQSSNADAAGITTDSVEVEVTLKNGQLEYSGIITGANGRKARFRSTGNGVVIRYTKSADDDDSFNGVELYETLDVGRLWVDVYTDYDYEVVARVSKTFNAGQAIPGWEMHGDGAGHAPPAEPYEIEIDGVAGTITCDPCLLNVGGIVGGNAQYTFTSNPVAPRTTSDSDYLAIGIWVYVPNDPKILDTYEYGAFIDGNQPFTQPMLEQTGSATYRGEATGVYANQGTGENIFFDADATLTADFGTDAELGTISGELSSFTEEGKAVVGNPTLTLSAAPIGATNSGFFTGDTSMTFEEETYAGKWGGQFYGNPVDPARPGDSNPAQPGSVAGTFGGATTLDGDGNAKSFVGAFGAHKE